MDENEDREPKFGPAKNIRDMKKDQPKVLEDENFFTDCDVEDD